ncbi:MAG: cytochrome c oxidase subunit [Symbiobacteriaceae bacterium]|jgi:nitric oxide reductase large subunit|nr:cytochrome c oxidase subunit [Symbiobacteriaceae bacterium]
MSNLSVGFIRTSVVYLLIGISFGLTMAIPGGLSWLMEVGRGQPTTAHAHANLLGFMLMMVMGVAYHIFPRFSGHPIRRMWMAWANFWSCQVGTALMVLGLLFRGIVPVMLPIGASVQVLGIVFFAINMFQVVRPVKKLMP